MNTENGKRRTKNPGNGAEGIDARAALRLRLRRVQLGISQPALAARVGLTYQQVQKYEKAENRLAPAQLRALACALDVSVDFFFQEAPEARGGAASFREERELVDALARDSAARALVDLYHGIPDARRRAEALEGLRELNRMNAGQPPSAHGAPHGYPRRESRTVALRDRRTSLRLEQDFWCALAEIASAEGTTVHVLVDRIDASRKRPLSSAVRVFVLNYFRHAVDGDNHAGV